MRTFWKGFFLLLGPLLLALFLGTMLMIAWPNAMKVAGFLCPDDRPDTFVVRYNVSTSEGEGTNWTLMCMSDRGEIYEVGTWLPLLTVVAIMAATLYALVILRVAWRLLRGGLSGEQGTPPIGAPPGAEDPFGT